MQAFGAAAVQAQPAQQDHARDRVGGLYQAGARQVVMDETLGAETGQQALRHALLQVQVHRFVGKYAGVLEDDRADGRFAPPLGQLLVAPARHAQRIQGTGPARIRLRLAGERRERPDRGAILGPFFLQRFGAQQLQRAGHRVAERLRLEVHPSA